MSSHSTRLLLLDTASLYYRAFHGVPLKRSNPDSAPNNAVRGLLDMVATLVGRYRPTHLVACWDDDWRPAFRVAAVPSYKAHRLAVGSTDAEDTPPELVPQVPVIRAALEASGILVVGAPGYEADDVIGAYVAQRATLPGLAADTPTDVVTGDRDLLQLVDDATAVRVVYTARGGVRAPDLVTQTELAAAHEVPTGAAYADLAVLRGDPSDGLPGVAGVGVKTAVKLIATYGSLARVRAAAADGDPGMTPTVRRRIVEACDYLDVAPAVVRVAADVPLPEVEPRLPSEPADLEALARIGVEHGVEPSVKRVVAAPAG